MGLSQAQGILCGSIVSGLRMQPGNWAGAYACWGTENREAAVRFVKGGPGSPYGGNVEVKIVDPSANPYLASAAILGSALDGIERQRRYHRKRPSTRQAFRFRTQPGRHRAPARISGRSHCRTG